MATLLDEQEEKIGAIETQAAGVAHDTEGGYGPSSSYRYLYAVTNFFSG